MSFLSIFDFFEGFIYFCAFYLFKCKEKKIKIEEELKKTFNFKEICVKWALKSNIHGVAHLVKTRHLVIKLLYSIGLLLSLVYCAYSLDKNIRIFYNFGVSSKYTIQVPAKSEYPALTFCSYNAQFSKKSFLQKSCFNETYEKKFSDDDLYPRNFYNNTFCFTLNVDSNALAEVFFDASDDKCLFVFNASNVILLIHKKNTMPEHGQSFRLFQSEVSLIGLSRITKKTLPQPYSTCVSSWDSIDQTIGNFYKKHHLAANYTEYEYSLLACVDYCMYELMIKNCEGSRVDMIFNDINFFTNCTFSIYSLKYEYCENICPDNCNTLTYNFNVATYSGNPELIQVYIYFDEVYLNEIKDSPKLDANEFLASIGFVI